MSRDNPRTGAARRFTPDPDKRAVDRLTRLARGWFPSLSDDRLREISAQAWRAGAELTPPDGDRSATAAAELRRLGLAELREAGAQPVMPAGQPPHPRVASLPKSAMLPSESSSGAVAPAEAAVASGAPVAEPDADGRGGDAGDQPPRAVTEAPGAPIAWNPGAPSAPSPEAPVPQSPAAAPVQNAAAPIPHSPAAAPVQNAVAPIPQRPEIGRQPPAEPASDDDRRPPSERTSAVLPTRLSSVSRVVLAGRAALLGARHPDQLARPAKLPEPKALTKPLPTTPIERWHESWRETDYLRRLELAVTAPRLARCVTIAVVSPKGGVGKTTITALLGMLLALLRRDRAVAIDTNPDYGSLGRALTPDHQVFVDDALFVLARPDLTATELDAHLGRAGDGLMVLPAPTDPVRMAKLDRDAYTRVIGRLQTMSGLLLLDCGTGLQEPAAQAAIAAADQFVVVSDAEPATASLVAEASALLQRAGKPIVVAVNKMPRTGARLDLAAFESRLRRARGLVVIESDPGRAARVARGEFTWTDSPGPWQRSLRELAVVLATEWSRLELTA